MNHQVLWLVAAVAALFALGLVAWILWQLRKGREAFKRVDYSKIRKWEDDDDWD